MKLFFVIGTRPEAIKMSPIIIAAKKRKFFSVVTCVTAQHRAMLDEVLSQFGIQPDYDLDIMKDNQNISQVLGEVIIKTSEIIRLEKPDWVFVQGDTATALGGAISGHYEGVKVGHVEAGLRSYNKKEPFPEEANRLAITAFADINFAPTGDAANNLLKESVDHKKIFVTGNTSIDAISFVRKEVLSANKHFSSKSTYLNLIKDKSLVLITAHRRENFGNNIRNICDAVKDAAKHFPIFQFVFIVHPNPHVRKAVSSIFELKKFDKFADDFYRHEEFKNLIFINHQNYFNMCCLLLSSRVILTDSGGLQEECPYLGKPVLVLRNTTERPEAISSGNAFLVGCEKTKILEKLSSLLNDKEKYINASRPSNIFGDGKASDKILDVIIKG